MNTQEQAFLNGFVKRAAENGIEKEQAFEMLKKASADEVPFWHPDAKKYAPRYDTAPANDAWYQEQAQKFKQRYGQDLRPVSYIPTPREAAYDAGVPFDKLPYGISSSDQYESTSALYGNPKGYYDQYRPKPKTQQVPSTNTTYKPKPLPFDRTPEEKALAAQKRKEMLATPTAQPVSEPPATQAPKPAMSPFFAEASKYFPGGQMTSDPKQQQELGQLSAKYNMPSSQTTGIAAQAPKTAPALDMKAIKNAPQVAPGSERYNVPSTR